MIPFLPVLLPAATFLNTGETRIDKAQEFLQKNLMDLLKQCLSAGNLEKQNAYKARIRAAIY